MQLHRLKQVIHAALVEAASDRSPAHLHVLARREQAVVAKSDRLGWEVGTHRKRLDGEECPLVRSDEVLGRVHVASQLVGCRKRAISRMLLAQRTGFAEVAALARMLGSLPRIGCRRRSVHRRCRHGHCDDAVGVERGDAEVDGLVLALTLSVVKASVLATAWRQVYAVLRGNGGHDWLVSAMVHLLEALLLHVVDVAACAPSFLAEQTVGCSVSYPQQRQQNGDVHAVHTPAAVLVAAVAADADEALSKQPAVMDAGASLQQMQPENGSAAAVGPRP